MKYICTFPTQFCGRIVKPDEVVDVAEGAAVPASFKRVEGGDGNTGSTGKSENSGSTGNTGNPAMLSADGYRAKLEEMKVPYPAFAPLEKLKEIYDAALEPRGKE